MKRKAEEATEVAQERDAADILRITPLGAGQEVGRSCILLEFKEKTVMLDCGLHPAHTGLAALPFFDNIDPSTVDILLITHFHIDHAAALPYLLQKTNFKGRVLMTHPTKSIFKWLLSDYVKVSSLSVDDALYDDKDLAGALERIEAVDFREERDLDGIKVTAFQAGHVLGAAMFLVEIAGVKVLYTGDYSREEDRHLMAAEKPPNVVPEVLIAESTYGVQSHQSRLHRESHFTKTIHKVVSRGGRCLIPVFALGRAQELLLILDEYWQAHPELHGVPIYYASALARRCMTVYQTYSNMMNDRIRKQAAAGKNPFVFKHISNLKGMHAFDDVGPCVMMASPGMLQSGQSRELLERWCTDARNGCLIPGYVVEGTLGSDILNNKVDSIVPMNGSGPRLPLNLLVEYVSFSAHVDYTQNREFIEEVGSQNLVLVHGAATEMGRLKSALASRYQESDKTLNIFTPKNCESVELYFKGERMAKVIGSLAQPVLKPGSRMSGVLVSKDFGYRIVSPRELPAFTDLVDANVLQKLVVGCAAPMSLVRWHVESMFGTIRPSEDDDDSFLAFDCVTVKDLGNHRFLLEWEGNPLNDMVADSILAILLQAESSPASVKATRSHHKHTHDDHKSEAEEEVEESNGSTAMKSEAAVDGSPGSDTEYEEVVTSFLVDQFGEESVSLEKASFRKGEGSQDEVNEESRVQETGGGRRRAWQVNVDGQVAGVVLERGKAPKIESTSDELYRRVSSIAGRVKRTLDPISETWRLPE